MRKCIHSINYMIKKNLALTDNYGDLITFIAQKLEEPITKQYLETCPKNATYISNTAAESMVDAMNFYSESKSLTEINESNFITLYADKAENASHKECFAMFATYYSNKAQKAVTSYLGILNLKGKTAAEIMDIIKNFFLAKSIKLDKIMFSVLDGTNSVSGKNTGLQRRIRFYSPFNM